MVQSIVTLFRTARTSSWAIVPKGFIIKHLYGAVIDLQGVIKGDFIIGQPERFSSPISFAEVLGQRNHFLNNLCSFDGPVLITFDRVLKHLCERSALDYVFSATCLDLAVQ